MAIFNSYVKLPEGKSQLTIFLSPNSANRQAFPRRWFGDPALSPLGASYGYFQLQREDATGDSGRKVPSQKK